ncbi:unnamed protein product [Chrysodeixis includens]|uniref:Uncharacterized protein n=1 Tax=Chrysodeixis includens TaxID=689277 RepID=A0A9P0BPW8_CHRIL|nr:unnamed protein product [Chrysodeixis includens]
MKGVVIACVAVFGIAGSTLAPFITPCREQDTVCLQMSAQKAVPILAAGIPAMGIARLDPMYVEQVRTSQAGLDMDFRNTSVTGLRNCEVLHCKRHTGKTFVDLKCSVMLVGDYTLGGKLLIMPIEGSGRYAIKIYDIVVKIMFKVGEKMVGGDAYWVVESWKHTAEVQTGAHFLFRNLFNGNKALSEAVHTFANENWHDIFEEVAPPIVKAIVSNIVDESTKLFDKVPIKDLVIQ